jgi:hypothetical protein
VVAEESLENVSRKIKNLMVLMKVIVGDQEWHLKRPAEFDATPPSSHTR